VRGLAVAGGCMTWSMGLASRHCLQVVVLKTTGFQSRRAFLPVDQLPVRALMNWPSARL